MPIFEYRCRDCGMKFEKILNSQEGGVTCKGCDSPRIEKLISVFAVTDASRQSPFVETGPCGACGAPRRGMCGD